MISYTSRGDGCGNYSGLRNGFSNAAIDKNQPLEIHIRGRAKYINAQYFLLLHRYAHGLAS